MLHNINIKSCKQKQKYENNMCEIPQNNIYKFDQSDILNLSESFKDTMNEFNKSDIFQPSDSVVEKDKFSSPIPVSFNKIDIFLPRDDKLWSASAAIPVNFKDISNQALTHSPTLAQLFNNEKGLENAGSGELNTAPKGSGREGGEHGESVAGEGGVTAGGSDKVLDEDELDKILAELADLESKLSEQNEQINGIEKTGWISPGVLVEAGEAGGGKGEVGWRSQPGRVSMVSAPSSSNQMLPQPHIPVLTHGWRSGDGNSPQTREPIQDPPDVPDSDSAFSDDVSMLSGSSGGSGGPRGQLRSQVEEAAIQKAEKIKIALQKISEASLRKVYVKVFLDDGSTKSLVVDSSMSVLHVIRTLTDKCHVVASPDFTITEHIPSLYMERHLEEHESLVENLLEWKVGSENKVLFGLRPSRHHLFREPEKFLLTPDTPVHGRNTRQNLLHDFFNSSNQTVPRVEGPLWLKSEGKKNWKKHSFVLRSSGLYYLPKGKKSSKSEPTCLATFDVNHVYTGFQWKKKFKSPTDFCFAIKHPKIQEKSPKYIHYLCAETDSALQQWMTGIRIVKSRGKLYENYKLLLEDIARQEVGANMDQNPEGEKEEEPEENPGSPENLVNNEVIYSPGSETASKSSQSYDSGVSSICEVNSEISSNTELSPGSEHCSELGFGFHQVTRSESPLSKSSGGSDQGVAGGSGGSDTSDSAFETDFPAGGTIKRNPKLPPATGELVKEITEDPSTEEINISGDSQLNQLQNSIKCGFQQHQNFEQISSTIRRKCTEPERIGIIVDQSDGDKCSDSFPPPPDDSEEEDNSDILPPPPPEAFLCRNSPRRGSDTSIQSLPPPPEESSAVSQPSQQSGDMLHSSGEKTQLNSVYPHRQGLNQQQGESEPGWQQSLYSHHTSLNQQPVFYPQRVAGTGESQTVDHHSIYSPRLQQSPNQTPTHTQQTLNPGQQLPNFPSEPKSPNPGFAKENTSNGPGPSTSYIQTVTNKANTAPSQMYLASEQQTTSPVYTQQMRLSALQLTQIKRASPARRNPDSPNERLSYNSSSGGVQQQSHYSPQSHCIYPTPGGHNPHRPESPRPGHTDARSEDLSNPYPVVLTQSAEQRPQLNSSRTFQQMELLSRMPNEPPTRPTLGGGSRPQHQQIQRISLDSLKENGTVKEGNKDHPMETKKKSSLKAPSSGDVVDTPKTSKKSKKISFDDHVQRIESSPPASPLLDRSQINRPIIGSSVRKSNPDKLFSSNSSVATPPREFLADLQRVMSKKWSISERCRSELNKLGSPGADLERDVVDSGTAPDYNERDVSNWILQSLKHYRASEEDLHQPMSLGAPQQQPCGINNTAPTPHYPPATNTAAHPPTHPTPHYPPAPNDQYANQHRDTSKIHIAPKNYTIPNPGALQHSTPYDQQFEAEIPAPTQQFHQTTNPAPAFPNPPGASSGIPNLSIPPEPVQTPYIHRFPPHILDAKSSIPQRHTAPPHILANQQIYSQSPSQQYSQSPSQQIYQASPNQHSYKPPSSQQIYQHSQNQPTYQSSPNQPTYQSSPNQPTYQSSQNQPTYQSSPNQPTYQQSLNQQIYQSSPRFPLVRGSIPRPGGISHQSRSPRPPGIRAPPLGRQLQRSQSAHSHTLFPDRIAGRFLDDQGVPDHFLDETRTPCRLLDDQGMRLPPPPFKSPPDVSIYGATGNISKKSQKLPPPPPKRSDSTHLSSQAPR